MAGRMSELNIVNDNESIALIRDGQTFWLDSTEAKHIIEVLSKYVEADDIGTKTSRKK